MKNIENKFSKLSFLTTVSRLLAISILASTVFGCATNQPLNSTASKKSITNEAVTDLSYEDMIQRIREYPTSENVSRSGLDPRAQKNELTAVMLYIYGSDFFPDVFWDDFNDKAKVQNELGLSDKSYECLVNNHNYKVFAKNNSMMVDEYVNKHSPQKVRDDLTLLMDSGLSKEIHDLMNGMLKDQENTEGKFLERFSEDSYLRLIFSLFKSNQSLSTLLGMGSSNHSFPNLNVGNRHLTQVMILCNGIDLE